MARKDGRAPDQLRPVRIITGFQRFAEGSALIEVGETHVLCAASVEEGVPAFLRDRGQGWITAEYGMLPRSTLTRTPREVVAGRASGRSQEIQRLIGRSLRAAVDLTLLGERTLRIDCDVLQADGGTRTAAITGSYIALVLALRRLLSEGSISTLPLRFAVAAVSAGVVDGQPLLDLCYEEDARAEVDFNVVMTSTGKFVEVQGTAEGQPFGKHQMNQLLTLSEKGIRELFLAQDHVLTTPVPNR